MKIMIFGVLDPYFDTSSLLNYSQMSSKRDGGGGSSILLPFHPSKTEKKVFSILFAYSSLKMNGNCMAKAF